jgi:anti-sigma B factor antagonist
VPLSLQSRRVGDIVVLKCAGRIVEGTESKALQQEFASLLPDDPYIVMDLADVNFIDSAGLGLLVRLLSRARAARGDLKLCAVPERVREVLRITRLGAIFDAAPTETDAVAAFYKPAKGTDAFEGLGGDVLCVTTSADVLAYACAILRGGGFGVMSSANLPDALTLLRASRPKVVVIDAQLHEARNTWTAGTFNELAGALPVIDLPPDFHAEEAGEAAARLLDRVRAAIGEPRIGAAG